MRVFTRLYMKRDLYFILAILLIVVPGCSPPTEQEVFNIGYSQCCDDPWRDVMNGEIRRELEFHPELILEMRTAGNNSEEQVRQIQELMDLGIDLLIVSPNEAQPLTPIIDQVYEAGIPVVLVDRKTDSEQFTVHVGADNYQIGYTAAKHMGSELNGRGKVVELALQLVTTPAIERHRGFKAGIADIPGIDIVGELNHPDYLNKIRDSLPSILRQHPDLKGIFCHTDIIAETAHEVLEDMGKSGDIFLMGVDGIPGPEYGMSQVEKGALDATMLYPTGGSEAIRVAAAILRGESTEKEYFLQTTVVDSTNVRVMQLQAQKILDQQVDIERQSEKLRTQTIQFRNQRVALIVLVILLVLTGLFGTLALLGLNANRKTNRKLAAINAEVTEQRNKTVELAEKARLANQAKIKFFTNISHEFRTPLTLILGPVDDFLQSDAHLSTSQRKDLMLVKSNALRLLRLVNQLMDFRKIENSKMELSVCELDLVDMLRQIMKAFERVAAQRHIQFQLDTKCQKKNIWVDPDKLDKVLFNLLSNAFKFTKDHGRIMVILDEDLLSDEVIIKVQDNGRGMSPEHVAHAFDRFYQGETYQSQGTGLGLSLSREFIQLHHGSISLQSEKGKGSTFVVRLPNGKQHFAESEILNLSDSEIQHDWEANVFASVAEMDLETPDNAPPQEEPETTLLIIEDQQDIRTFLQQKLQQDFRILEAANGDAGIRIAEEEVPDLIICDWLLPGKSGIEVTQALRGSLTTSHIPIIMLTAKNSLDQRITGLKSGADVYITKPFHVSYLREQLKSLIRNREILRERYLHELHPEQPGLSPDKLERSFTNRFVAEIEARISDPDLSVQDLCESMGMSRVQLYRKVKAVLGYSVNEYLKQVRLKKASHLLLEPDKNIADVAYEVGFSSPAYFSTVFKQAFHITPKQYRQQNSSNRSSKAD